MTCPEYMRMKIKDLLEEFVTMFNLTNKATADGFVYIKFKKECMAYHRWVFSHKNSWSNVSINTATVRAPSLQASGDTTHDLYHSHFAWTISV